MLVFMAQGAWRGLEKTYPIKETTIQDIETLKLADEKYHEIISGTKPIGSNGYSIVTRFASDIYRHSDTLNTLLNEGKATVEQDGNCEGWGLSLSNMEEAVALCTATVEAYAKKKDEESILWKSNRDKLIEKIEAIPAEKLEQDVYYYFKQDYHYRGMFSTFTGSVKLKQIVEFAITNLDYEAVGDKDKEIFPVEEYYDWNEIFSDKDDAILTLLEESKVVTTGEIGYHALSLNSENEARDLVKEAFVESEFE